MKSANQKVSQKTLVAKLAQFGLNPREWQIAPGNFFDKVLLIHKRDPEFQLIGAWGAKGLQGLELLSI